MLNWVTRARLFVNETLSELRKCSWPERQQLFESTVLVIITVLMLATFVAIVDYLSMFIIEKLTM